jgi:hypothetical protein
MLTPAAWNVSMSLTLHLENLLRSRYSYDVWLWQLLIDWTLNPNPNAWGYMLKLKQFKMFWTGCSQKIKIMTVNLHLCRLRTLEWPHPVTRSWFGTVRDPRPQNLPPSLDPPLRIRDTWPRLGASSTSTWPLLGTAAHLASKSNTTKVIHYTWAASHLSFFFN